MTRQDLIFMIQLAIDPSTIYLGYSVMDTDKTIGTDIVKYGLIQLCENIRLQDIRFSDKLLSAYNNFAGLISQYTPDVIALEDQFHTQRKPTVKNIIRITGAIILAAKQKHIPVVMYPPQTVKLAVAKNGKADKDSVASAILKLYEKDNYVSLLRFSDKQSRGRKKTDDIFDSIAINLTHRFTRNGEQI